VAARAAECAGADCDRGGAAIRRAAGRCDRDGDDLQLAGAGAADGERDFESRLCAGAGVFVVDRADVCVGELFYGCGLQVGQSPNEVSCVRAIYADTNSDGYMSVRNANTPD
jgi:hypothetical protein